MPEGRCMTRLGERSSTERPRPAALDPVEYIDKVLSQLSSFLRKITYLPFNVKGFMEYTYNEDHSFYPFLINKIKLNNFCKFFFLMTVYRVNFTLYKLLCEEIGKI